jgi:hypothetical protein
MWSGPEARGPLVATRCALVGWLSLPVPGLCHLNHGDQEELSRSMIFPNRSGEVPWHSLWEITTAFESRQDHHAEPIPEPHLGQR